MCMCVCVCVSPHFLGRYWVPSTPHSAAPNPTPRRLGWALARFAGQDAEGRRCGGRRSLRARSQGFGP